MAKRVLPEPPAPVSVNRRVVESRRFTSSISRLRPTKLVNCSGIWLEGANFFLLHPGYAMGVLCKHLYAYYVQINLSNSREGLYRAQPIGDHALPVREGWVVSLLDVPVAHLQLPEGEQGLHICFVFLR